MSYFNILVLFQVNTLSFCENVDITYNVSITSLTQKKKKNSCKQSMPMFWSMVHFKISNTQRL